jgi:hypothetical protein
MYSGVVVWGSWMMEKFKIFQSLFLNLKGLYIYIGYGNWILVGVLEWDFQRVLWEGLVGDLGMTMWGNQVFWNQLDCPIVSLTRD